MSLFLAIFGSVLAASGTVPYVIAIWKRQTKPRLVTWLTWALLTGLAAVAAFSDGQVGAGLFALLGTLSTAAIVTAGLRYGDRSFERLDILCQAGVFVGLFLWVISRNPIFAVWAAIIIDFVGLIPTVKHSWRAPHEETAITYVFVAVGGALNILPVLLYGTVSVVSIGYPLYAALSLGGVALLIVARRRLVMKPVDQSANHGTIV